MDSPGGGGESNYLEERRQIENWERNLVDRELEGKEGTRGKPGEKGDKNRGKTWGLGKGAGGKKRAKG